MLRCADDTFYTGITTDLPRRLREHNGEAAGGAKYTKPRRPVTLVYQKTCNSRGRAQQHEYAIKQLTRKEKYELIAAYASKKKSV